MQTETAQNIIGTPLRTLTDSGRQLVAEAIAYTKTQCVGLETNLENIALACDLLRLLILRQAEHGEWSELGINCARDMGPVQVAADYRQPTADAPYGSIAFLVQLPAFIAAPIDELQMN
jgi:hypothetical protein